MLGDPHVRQLYEQEAKNKIEEQRKKSSPQMKHEFQATPMLKKETTLAILFLVLVIGAILLLHFN